MATKSRSQGRRDSGTGSIYRDGEGYRVQVLLGHDPATGKPIVKKCRASTHEAAVEALARLQQSNRQGRLAAPTGLTLGKYLDDWLEVRVRPHRAPKTYQQRKWAIETHILPTLGKKRLDRLTRRDVQGLVSALATHPVQSRAKSKGEDAPKADSEPTRRILGRRTLEVVVAVLHASYEDAIRDGIATQNPATYIDLPPAPRKAPEFLTPDQVGKLNGKLDGSSIRELIRFMIATGARLGEATGIRWTDVDLDKGFVRICGQLQRIAGKLEYRPVTKTNQDRTPTLPHWLVDDLKSLRAKQLIDGHTDPDGIAFLNPFGRRLDAKYVYKELARLCHAAKIPPVSPHKLRHTAATLALMETGDLHGVQKMLGHQQVALTSNLYGHATAERLRPITDALGKLIAPNLEPTAD